VETQEKVDPTRRVVPVAKARRVLERVTATKLMHVTRIGFLEEWSCWRWCFSYVPSCFVVQGCAVYYEIIIKEMS
jgi:hypothetical protein